MSRQEDTVQNDRIDNTWKPAGLSKAVLNLKQGKTTYELLKTTINSTITTA